MRFTPTPTTRPKEERLPKFEMAAITCRPQHSQCGYATAAEPWERCASRIQNNTEANGLMRGNLP
jgi:hypothetical protein